MVKKQEEEQHLKSLTFKGNGGADHTVKQTSIEEKFSKFEKESRTSAKSETATGLTGSMIMMPRKRSVSRDSSLGEEHSKSLIDSISAASGRNNWSGVCCQDTIDDDPSISSIKGDSVSATIADYNRKHGANKQHPSSSVSQHDNQSRGSVGGGFGTATASCSRSAIGEAIPNRNDGLSATMNLFAAGGSSSSGLIATQTNNPQANINSKDTKSHEVSVSISPNINIGLRDACDVIEENGNNSTSSTCDDLSYHQSGRKQLRSQRSSTLAATSKKASYSKAGKKHHSKLRKSHHHHHLSRHHVRRQSSQQLEQETSAPFEYEDLPLEAACQIEPIIIRGNGNLTLFGLSNSFNSEFPSSLVGRVSKEEYDRTITRINSLLRDQQSLSAKLLLIGGLFCCCSLGFSLVWPSIALKKRSKMNLEKYLATENSRLYSKLGLNWKLAEQRCYSNHAFVEYVLMIEFTPKLNLYQPD